MVKTCQEHLNSLVQFTPCEDAFLDRLLDHGEIVPSLLTKDSQMAARIQDHPLLKWKALNVQRHRVRMKSAKSGFLSNGET